MVFKKRPHKALSTTTRQTLGHKDYSKRRSESDDAKHEGRCAFCGDDDDDGDDDVAGDGDDGDGDEGDDNDGDEGEDDDDDTAIRLAAGSRISTVSLPCGAHASVSARINSGFTSRHP